MGKATIPYSPANEAQLFHILHMLGATNITTRASELNPSIWVITASGPRFQGHEGDCFIDVDIAHQLSSNEEIEGVLVHYKILPMTQQQKGD